MIINIDIDKLDFAKSNGLLPAIIVDYTTGKVLMLGYMNKESLELSLREGKVTFYSRSRAALWTKGETSGNYLFIERITVDCDFDTLLIYARPAGPVCHTGTYSCFNEQAEDSVNFLLELSLLIQQRKKIRPESSYTTTLFNRGENRIIQKVGEEAIETVIAAKNNDRAELINEVSDLLYHLLVLLAEKEIPLTEVVTNLEKRHRK